MDSLKQSHDPEVRHTLLHSLSGAAGLYGDAELCSLTQKAIHSLLQNQINSYEEMVTEISLNIEKIVQAYVINIS